MADRWYRVIPFEIRAALAFGGVSAAWIYYSDRAVAAIGVGTEELTRLQNVKGWFFVAMTTAIVYGLLRYYRLKTRRTIGRMLASEQELRDVVENGGAAIMLTAPDGRILSANRAACDMFGYSEAAIRTLGRAEIVASDPARLAAALSERERTGSFTGELTYRRSDGTVFEGATTSRIYGAPDGSRRTVVIVRDVTHQVEAERRLALSEARYRAMFEEHLVPTLLIDPADSRIVDANPAAAAFYGWTVAELRTKHIHDLNTLGSVETRQRMQGLESPQGRWFRFVHRTASGALRPVEVHSGPVVLDGRRLLLSLVHDQTPIDKVQTSLARLNRLFRMLSETNQALMRETEREALFRRVCEIAVEAGGFKFAWVGVVTPDGGIAVRAKAGEDHGYVDALQLTVDASRPEGNGATARAIRSGAPVVQNDFHALATNAPWLERAKAAGIRASAALPIRERGVVVGALCLYSTEADFFDSPEVTTLGSVVDDVSFGLDRLDDAVDRTTMLEELERAERRWRYALDGAGHGVWEWDFRSGAVEVSPVLAAMIGYPPSEVPRTLDQWLELIHPDDHANLTREFDRFRSGEIPSYHSEYRVRCRNGSWKWVLSNGTVLDRGPDGVPLRAVGTQVDLTPVRAAESARREFESRAQAMIDHSPDLIVLCRREHVTYINKGGLSMLGASASTDVVGRSIYDLVPADDVASVRRWVETLTSKPGSVARGIANRILTRSGDVIEIETSGVSYMSDDVCTLQLTCRELTTRQRTDRSETEMRDRLALAVTTSGLGIFDLNLVTGETVVSPEYARMLGEDPATFHQTFDGWRASIHPEDVEMVTKAVQDYLSGAAPEYKVEFRMRTRSGDYKWIFAVGSVAERDDRGRPIRVLGTQTDVTARHARAFGGPA